MGRARSLGLARGVILALACAAFAGCAGRGGEGPTTPSPAIERPARAWSAAALAELRAALDAAPAQGFASDLATLAELDRLDRASARDADAAAALDALADETFARLATYFAAGAVDPAQIDPEWRFPRPAAPDIAALRASVAAGVSPSLLLNGLLPTAPDYSALIAELAALQALPASDTDANGRARDARIDAVRANLERWRWLPRELPGRRIDVLVPFFELRLRDGAAPAIVHPVIVGARRTPSPSFGAAINSITLNPTWTPPSSILTNELLPRFRRDPGAAEADGFDVLDRAGQVVDPALVDWRARPFPYTLRQRAGAGNALGRLRFDLPNPYAVYLHDTPSRGLFARADRALSHGCIRVSEPETLAAAVLADPAWSLEALQTAIEIGETQTVQVPTPLPIYIVYLTAARDTSGAIGYADDIYRRDAPLLRALDNAGDQIAALDAGDATTECAALGL
ncbi:L,D-transpeptidase family protein [Vitreimonas sp.]|uniref:L,D-transpeptidase family protein n=1 Tax=Vitreimonas sp. TaxID=3069702 RepID=UPI002EDB1388